MRLRVHLVPDLVIGVSALLILSNMFTCQEIITNDLTIDFVSSVDDLTTILFIGQRRKKLMELTVAQVLKQRRRLVGWERNRL